MEKVSDIKQDCPKKHPTPGAASMPICVRHNYRALGKHECPDCVKDERDNLLAALKTLVPYMDMAFNAEGDIFGVHHNDATDALSKAEALIATASKP